MMRTHEPRYALALGAIVALVCLAAASVAEARGGGESNRIARIKWTCTAKSVSELEGLIKKGPARRLAKKDIDAARDHYEIAKRALQEKDTIRCEAALRSGGQILARARPEKVVARSCRDALGKLETMIAYAIEGNADARKLSAAEAQRKKAEAALKLKGKKSASRGNTLCLKHADAATALMTLVRKDIKALIEADFAARMAKCKRLGSRTCTRERRARIKRVGPEKLFLCNTHGFALLNAAIAGGGEFPKARRVAQKHLAIAKPARSARQWSKCLTNLKSGVKVIEDERAAKQAAQKQAALKAEMFPLARNCHYLQHKDLARILKSHGADVNVAKNVVNSATVIYDQIRGVHIRGACKKAMKISYSAAEMPHLATIRNFNKTVMAKSSVSRKQNVDIPGPQYKLVTFHGGKSPQRAGECQILCQADKRCRAFTFASSANGRGHYCYLKGAKGGSVAANGVTSGTKTFK